MRQLGTFDTPGWNAQLQLHLPARHGARPRRHYARPCCSSSRRSAQLKAQELTITTEVTNAGLAVENTYKQYQAAQKAREAAETNAEAERTRFDVGMSTNFEVVQAQQNG